MNTQAINVVGPALRGLLAGKGTALKLVAFSAGDAGKADTDAVCKSPIDPGLPMTVVESLRKTVLDFEAAHGCKPAVISIPGLGRFTASTPTGTGRVAGKVAVVTGAAQGFGLEISRHLAAALHETVKALGGLDLLVSNAGVLKAGSVKTQSPADFDFVTAVNYKGYFLCVQGAAPILSVQHLAKPDYWSDIIQINSKSGLEGSNRNGAYAGSKFGGIGLTQSFAMELVEDNIKVNSICPGNFFDGPLWADPDNGLFVQYLRTGKVPGARTVEDVKRFYEAKVPMRRGCTADDVMKAIFYLIEQTYETGQAVPVTGGQVMLS